MGNKQKRDPVWLVVCACFLMGFFFLGFCSGNKSLYLSAITEALNIPRSLFSFSDSIRYLTTAGINLVFGALLHKLGVRKMVALGVLCLIIQSILNAVATTLWGFYAAGIFMGLGLAFCTTTMISFIIRRWCKKNTGKILGFALAANGVGSALATQVISPIIYQEGNPFGYRQAYLLMAGVLVVVGLLVVPMLREKPQEGPVTQNGGKSGSRDWPGIDYSLVKKKPYFYIAALCIFLTGMCLQGLSGISAAHMRDSGMDPGKVAAVLSICSLVLAVSKFLTGFSYDKFGMRLTMTLCDVSAVLGTLFLTMVDSSRLGEGFAYLYAIFSALALPLETIMLSLFAAELFGTRAFPHTMGIFAAVNTAGYAASTPLANWVYDACGTYTPVILAFCGIMLAVSITFHIILTVAYKERKAVLAGEAPYEA